MASAACGSSLFTTFVTGFSQAINWKPTEFVNDLRGTRSCTLCGVVPNETLLLDCCHTFCKTCYDSFRAEGQTCPVDGDSFDDAQVTSLKFSESRLLARQVRCWNKQHGCNFEGSLAEMLCHFHEQCGFHHVPCFRCNAVVQRNEMLHHYRNVCVKQTSTGSPTTSGFTGDVLKTGKAIEDKLSTLIDAQASLQDSLNSLTVATGHVLQNMESYLSGLDDRFGKLEEDIRSAEDSIRTSHTHELTQIRENWDIFFIRYATSSKRTQTTLETVPGLFRHNDWLKSISSSVFPVTVDKVCWTVEHISYHVKRALENGDVLLRSDHFTTIGYIARVGMKLARAGTDVDIGVHLTICRSSRDDRLDWPFTVPFTLGLIHPKDSAKGLRKRVDPRDVGLRHCFQRPLDVENTGVGLKVARRKMLDDFIVNDALLVSLELER